MPGGGDEVILVVEADAPFVDALVLVLMDVHVVWLERAVGEVLADVIAHPVEDVDELSAVNPHLAPPLSWALAITMDCDAALRRGQLHPPALVHDPFPPLQLNRPNLVSRHIEICQTPH